MTAERIDLGHDHWLTFFQWKPDRKLNPQWDGFPDIEKAGAVVGHLTPGGDECLGAINFDVGRRSEMEPKRPLWTVESWDPLTVSPSLLCECGDHGFIRNGKWVPA